MKKITLSILLAISFNCISQSVSKQLDSLETLMKRTNNVSIERALKKISLENPTNARSYYLLSNLYGNRGFYTESFDYIEEAIDLDPGNATNYWLKSKLFNAEAKAKKDVSGFYKALEAVDEMQNIGASSATIYLYRAELHNSIAAKNEHNFNYYIPKKSTGWEDAKVDIKEKDNYRTLAIENYNLVIENSQKALEIDSENQKAKENLKYTPIKIEKLKSSN